ncbi:MAG: hypothetical protein ACOCTU_02285 [Bacteroidota bacterium]
MPGVAGFMLLYILGKLNINIFFPVHQGWVPMVMMIVEALFALVLPLWYRILFVNKSRGRKYTDKNKFMQFEKHFLTLASISVYILIAGYLMALPGIPLSVMLLFVLYALYFYFPSEKRIGAEQKIFRVN